MTPQSIPEFENLSDDEQRKVRLAVGPKVMRDPRYYLPLIAQGLIFLVLLRGLPHGQWRLLLLAAYIGATAMLFQLQGKWLLRKHVAAHFAAKP